MPPYEDNATTLPRDVEATNSSNGSSFSPYWDLSHAQSVWLSALLAAFYLATLAANVGVVHYERVVPDVHRTLINRLAALASVYQCGVATAVYPMLSLRLVLGRGGDGGLGVVACGIDHFLLIFSLIQLVFVFNEIIFVRFVYVCWVGAVGTFREEIILAVLVGTNAFLAGFFAAVLKFLASDNVFHNYCLDASHPAGKS